jgi:hypothetical protein
VQNLTVTVPARFCGPPASGNGGYTAGLLAEHLDGPRDAGGAAAVGVTLRRPPPLERPLTVERTDGRVELRDGDELVAEARSVALDVDEPPVIGWDDAVVASAASTFRDRSSPPFPSCFACGPDRAEGDGLRLFAGRVGSSEIFATPWVPDDVRVPIVWAALDCPSSAPAFADESAPGPFVLGRIAARIDRPPEPGARHVVTSAAVGRDGRKFHAVSAVRDLDGRRCALARATWIQLTNPA